jgi:hypothetical protein
LFCIQSARFLNFKEKRVEMNQDEIKDFPSYQEMYDRFISEKVPKDTADREAKELCLLSEPVKERFCHWWHTGELIDDLKESKRRGRISSFIAGHGVPGAFVLFDEIFFKPPKTRTFIEKDEEGNIIAIGTRYIDVPD